MKQCLFLSAPASSLHIQICRVLLSRHRRYFRCPHQRLEHGLGGIYRCGSRIISGRIHYYSSPVYIVETSAGEGGQKVYSFANLTSVAVPVVPVPLLCILVRHTSNCHHEWQILWQLSGIHMLP